MANEDKELESSQGEESARLIEKAAVPIGIATGVLGALLAIGFALLPTSSLAEKGYVIAASLALSVASVGGIGAWRSGRRFALTAGLTGVAVVCLAALSVAGQAGPTPDVSQSDAPTPSTSTAAMAASVGTQSPSSQGPSPSPSGSAASAASLVSMTPVGGASAGFQTGPPLEVADRSYQQTLSNSWIPGDCNGSIFPADDSYSLDYKYKYFTATVGVADSSASGDTVQFSVIVDGQQEGPATILPIGQTTTIRVNVTQKYRITLQDACISATDNSSESITAVWINPTVSN